MRELDESDIIKIFQKGFGIKHSEDVDVLSLGKIKVVAKTDTLVESTDIPPGMRLSDAARKSIVACVSDFAAKGIRPRYGIISVNLTRGVSRSKVNEIVSGFKRACREFDVTILGGDTNQGLETVFNVCLFGVGDKIVSRGGSRKGDLIFVTGPFGYTSAGLGMLLGKRRGTEAFVRKAIKTITSPIPRLDFGVKNQRYFTSSMDSSDGLSATLNEMSRQSSNRFIIERIPAPKDLEDFALSYGLDSDDLVFNGGEEYEFVFTVSPRHKGDILRNAAHSKTPIMEIGHVTAGSGIYVLRDGRQSRLRDLGWKHFRQ